MGNSSSNTNNNNEKINIPSNGKDIIEHKPKRRKNKKQEEKDINKHLDEEQKNEEAFKRMFDSNSVRSRTYEELVKLSLIKVPKVNGNTLLWDPIRLSKIPKFKDDDNVIIKTDKKSMDSEFKGFDLTQDDSTQHNDDISFLDYACDDYLLLDYKFNFSQLYRNGTFSFEDCNDNTIRYNGDWLIRLLQNPELNSHECIFIELAMASNICKTSLPYPYTSSELVKNDNAKHILYPYKIYPQIKWKSLKLDEVLIEKDCNMINDALITCFLQLCTNYYELDIINRLCKEYKHPRTFLPTTWYFSLVNKKQSESFTKWNSFLLVHPLLVSTFIFYFNFISLL
jgi:hypothetical protein